jgi:hypothetical protein
MRQMRGVTRQTDSVREIVDGNTERGSGASEEREGRTGHQGTASSLTCLEGSTGPLAVAAVVFPSRPLGSA